MLTVSFQLPRIAKPSGTSTGPATPRVAPLFQLPRIAKPSGTRTAPEYGNQQTARFNFPG